MLREFVNYFQTALNKKLDEKTSWGRNEIKNIIKECIDEALMRILEK